MCVVLCRNSVYVSCHMPIRFLMRIESGILFGLLWSCRSLLREVVTCVRSCCKTQVRLTGISLRDKRQMRVKSPNLHYLLWLTFSTLPYIALFLHPTLHYSILTYTNLFSYTLFYDTLLTFSIIFSSTLSTILLFTTLV